MMGMESFKTAGGYRGKETKMRWCARARVCMCVCVYAHSCSQKEGKIHKEGNWSRKRRYSIKVAHAN